MMEQQEQQIIEGALAMYLRFGIKSVTMDDVASELGMSKKTIYRFFENKAELVDRVVKHLFGSVVRQLEETSAKHENAIDELFAMDQVVGEAIKKNHPAIMFQLRKYYPDSFAFIMEARRNMILSMTRNNLQKGIQSGLFRGDMDVEIIAQLYYSRVLLIGDENHFLDEDCPVEAFNRENLVYHIRGIASESGIAYLTQKLKNQ
jgi:AcrR family transcriptional regulator